MDSRVVRTSAPSMRVAPLCEPPQELIAAMAASGAHVENEGFCVVRIAGVGSPAWELYKSWACSLGDIDPMVQAVFRPPPSIANSASAPNPVLSVQIEREARSIINHIAPLRAVDFQGGFPVLPPPLPAPAAPTNVHHAVLAVTALVSAISNPGANYPVINGLQHGVYICHVEYSWRTANFAVPVFRLP